MAKVLRPAGRPPSTAWWPVDKLLFFYLALTGLAILVFHRRIPHAGWLLGLHLAAMGLIILMMKPSNPLSWVFRHWYPVAYVTACYKEMAVLIPAIRRTDLDAELARLDYRLWGCHPTVWLERIQAPLLTESLQILYSLFVPAVLLIAFLIWRRGRFADFRYYAFLISLGFLASYVGYFLVPVRGPRFLLQPLQHTELHGLWLFQLLQGTLDRLESAHYDCFPSGHTELAMLACWGSRQISPRLFWAYFGYTLSIIFATVYLRYHYTVDVLAGVLLAVLLLSAGPGLYQTMRKKEAT